MSFIAFSWLFKNKFVAIYYPPPDVALFMSSLQLWPHAIVAPNSFCPEVAWAKETAEVPACGLKRHLTDMEHVYMICRCKHVHIYIICFLMMICRKNISTLYLRSFRWKQRKHHPKMDCFDPKKLGLQKAILFDFQHWGRLFSCFFLPVCLTDNFAEGWSQSQTTAGRAGVNVRPDWNWQPIAIGRFLVTKHSILAFETAHQLRPTSPKTLLHAWKLERLQNTLLG